MPLAKSTSPFFSDRLPSIFTADSNAASWRSVLKMLNSLSSAVYAAPVSASLSSPVLPLAVPVSDAVKPRITLPSTSRSAVKSCRTSRLVVYVITATRSDGVIWVLTNFMAACCARIWSATGMPAWSKNITIKRRSLYFTSPALAGAMALAAFTGAAAGVASGFTAAAAPGAAAVVSSAASSSRWNSKTLTCCALPSSVMVKSVGLSPSSGAPFLSLAETFTTTNRSEEHTSELQSPCNLVCRLLLDKKTFVAQTHEARDHFPSARYGQLYTAGISYRQLSCFFAGDRSSRRYSFHYV